MKIRLFEDQDTTKVARLFHETVREINSCDYSLAQVNAWAPDNIYFRDWRNICSSRFTYVADDQGTIAGFGGLEANGYIDCFYCHKSYQRCGIGRQIYRAIETKAIELTLRTLTTEASITAKTFFQQMGFLSLEKQEVICRGEVFVNYKMEKLLFEVKH